MKIDLPEKKALGNLWRNKNFLVIWIGTSISNLTFQILTLMFPLLIYNLTSSTLAMSTMRIVEVIPNIALGIIIGVVVDRYNRKLLMKSSIFLQLLSLVFLYVLMWSENVSLLSIYILGFIIYTSSYTFLNAYNSILPLMINREELINANSYITMVTTVINIAGPGFAGVVIFRFGNTQSLIFTIIGLIVLLSSLSVVQIGNSSLSQTKKEFNFKSDITNGWHALKGNTPLWVATKMIMVFNFAASLSGAVLIYYALNTFGVNEKKISLIFICSGVGGLIGALLAKKVGEKLGFRYMTYTTFVIASLSHYILFMALEWYWLAIGMFFIGVSVTIFNIHYITMRQKTTPNHLLGRVIGTASMLMRLMMPIGFLTAGLLGEMIPVNIIFLLSGLFLMITVLITALSRNKFIPV